MPTQLSFGDQVKSNCVRLAAIPCENALLRADATPH